MPGASHQGSAELPDIPNQQGTDPAPSSPVQDALRRFQETADERQAVAADKLAKLWEDPRFVTLERTGQITTAAALAKEDATGTTELPRVHRTPVEHRRVNTRGGRSYPEGTENELDPYMNGTITGPELTPAEAARAHQAGHDIVEEYHLKKAAERYQEELAAELAEKGTSSQSLAHLRAQGFRPDPNTRGTTVVRVNPDSQK